MNSVRFLLFTATQSPLTATLCSPSLSRRSASEGTVTHLRPASCHRDSTTRLRTATCLRAQRDSTLLESQLTSSP
ncbi:hypothetical protein VNO80_19152 [Phaseolus coccineus]|uniref:Uncharacterized protein n=1 Tax=Phaseolus coccineus TaxID=3886 RepID=A0AAN9MFL4_PHACN